MKKPVQVWNYLSGFVWWGVTERIDAMIELRDKNSGRYFREALARVPKRYKKEVLRQARSYCIAQKGYRAEREKFMRAL